MRATAIGLHAVVLLLAAAAPALGQPDPNVILNQSFESDAGGWLAMGEGASLRVTREAGQRSSALALSYALGAGKLAGAVLPVPGGLARMRRLRLSIRSDHDTAVGLILSEKKPGGGDYAAFFWASANSWQEVELTPADFSANNGPNDPVDRDGRLDLDQVQGIGVFDLAAGFSSMPDSPNSPIIVSRSTGTHTLLIAGFQALASGGEARRGGAANELWLDAFDRGFLQWMTLGGTDLQLSVQGNPLGVQALQASYEQAEGRYSVLTRRLANFDLSSAKRLAFDVASDRDAVLAVSLELNQPGASNGPRYTLTIFPPAGRKPFHVNVRLADFDRDPNSTAGPLRVEAARLKSITIVDVTAATAGDIGPNTLWIANLEGLPE